MGIFDELNELHSAQVAYETEPEETDEVEELSPDWVLTVDELMDYAKLHGNAAAASLLLLCGVDAFDGDYESMMDKLAGVSWSER